MKTGRITLWENIAFRVGEVVSTPEKREFGIITSVNDKNVTFRYLRWYEKRIFRKTLFIIASGVLLCGAVWNIIKMVWW